MSSSDTREHTGHSPVTGRVIMGMDTPGPNEMTVQELEGKRSLLWDESVNDEYLARVRSRAQAMAKDILAKAMQEAEQIKASAHEEGYQEGIAKAQGELDQHVQTLGETFQGAIESLSAQGSEVWASRRDDLVALVKLAVAKTLKIEMEDHRVESLTALLDEAVMRLESQRELTVRCAPQDQELLDELLRQSQERNPAISHWKIMPDPNLEMGGVIVETGQSKVDNSVAARWEGVEPILDQLTVARAGQEEPAE